MCGIFGVRSWGPPPKEARVIQARDTLHRRGPDGAGYVGLGPIALAHRRLSIVDLSDAGAQPMSDGDSKVHFVFNGMIYNFRKLRRELEAAGHRFRSNTDSEVIAHGFKEWGSDVFRRLDGMYAIALWDMTEECLWLARDRAGEKPLFWTRHGEELIFGSTLDSLLAYAPELGRVSETTLNDYFSFGLSRGPKSLLEGVEKVRPGSVLRVDRDGAAREHSHWSLLGEALRPALPARSFLDRVDELEDIIVESVRSRLHADVPLGAFLSGGIDSSIVCAVLAKLRPETVTYTIGFDNPKLNEAAHAKAVADSLGLRNELMMLNEERVFDFAENLGEAYDEPIADPSAVPTMAVSALAKEHMTVALTGDGADEFFGGYRYYSALHAFSLSTALPSALRAAGSSLGSKVRHPRWRRILERASAKSSGDFFGRSGFYRGGATPTLARLLPKLSPASIVDSAFEEFKRRGVRSETEAGMLWDANVTLPDAWLTKVDRASMFVALETRAPLLAPEVLSFALRTPLSAKVNVRERKRVLKAVLERYVPREIIDRPKQGFAPPAADWLRGPLFPVLENVVQGSPLVQAGFFEKRMLRTVLEEHRQKQVDHTSFLWALYAFETWRAHRGIELA